jgi:hypothetical protein
MLLEQLRRSWYDSSLAYARVAITGSPRYGRAPNALGIAVLFKSRFRLVRVSSMVIQYCKVVMVEVLRMYPLVILVLVTFPSHRILGTRLTFPVPAPRIYDLGHHPLGVTLSTTSGGGGGTCSQEGSSFRLYGISIETWNTGCTRRSCLGSSNLRSIFASPMTSVILKGPRVL